MKTGVELIAKERERQIKEEGWSSEHDSVYFNNELVLAAISYALPESMREKKTITLDVYDEKETDIPIYFSWQDKWWKPTPEDRTRELVKAGALIAAEIDRINNNR